MTHKTEDQERPFVTWSKGKQDSDRIVMIICCLLVPLALLAIGFHIFQHLQE